MNTDVKKERLVKLKQRLESELDQDYGDQTEYLDRALDQINYAINELDSEERTEQKEIGYRRF